MRVVLPALCLMAAIVGCDREVATLPQHGLALKVERSALEAVAGTVADPAEPVEPTAQSIARAFQSSPAPAESEQQLDEESEEERLSRLWQEAIERGWDVGEPIAAPVRGLDEPADMEGATAAAPLDVEDRPLAPAEEDLVLAEEGLADATTDDAVVGDEAAPDEAALDEGALMSEQPPLMSEQPPLMSEEELMSEQEIVELEQAYLEQEARAQQLEAEVDAMSEALNALAAENDVQQQQAEMAAAALFIHMQRLVAVQRGMSLMAVLLAQQGGTPLPAR